MAASPMDAETILSATEDVLRRHGPAKATVLDVARALGVSHASVYRHFGSKAALREAATRRWLGRAHDGLAAVAGDGRLNPAQRLRGWLAALFAAKRAKASDDPELFATYRVLVTEHSGVVADHVAELVGQLRGIVAAGVGSGDFTAPDPDATALAVFHATTRFHDPEHAVEWAGAGIDAEFDAVCALVIDGLRAR